MAAVAGAALGVAVFGVRTAGVLAGAFMRTGSGISRASGAGFGTVATGAGVAGSTTPTRRSPAGAAIRLTL